jgi:hypothetical protein
MRITYPPDVTSPADRTLYRRGWQDRGAVGGAKGGKIGGRSTSDAKAAAAKANGAKGGRPRKDAPKG